MFTHILIIVQIKIYFLFFLPQAYCQRCKIHTWPFIIYYSKNHSPQWKEKLEQQGKSRVCAARLKKASLMFTSISLHCIFGLVAQSSISLKATLGMWWGYPEDRDLDMAKIWVYWQVFKWKTWQKDWQESASLRTVFSGEMFSVFDLQAFSSKVTDCNQYPFCSFKHQLCMGIKPHRRPTCVNMKGSF